MPNCFLHDWGYFLMIKHDAMRIPKADKTDDFFRHLFHHTPLWTIGTAVKSTGYLPGQTIPAFIQYTIQQYTCSRRIIPGPIDAHYRFLPGSLPQAHAITRHSCIDIVDQINGQPHSFSQHFPEPQSLQGRIIDDGHCPIHFHTGQSHHHQSQLRVLPLIPSDGFL